MGQEQSSLIDDDTPPVTLEERTVEAVADYIKSGQARRIVVMTGAGISTSAGIPDFRSKDTGLYANLANLDLPHPEAVFDISYFRQNPLPFYTLAHELYPGKFRPTIAHSFIRLLYDKGLLLKLFTQNVDCLEREAGVPEELIVEAHGSFAHQRCIDCYKPFPGDRMRAAVESKQVPRCSDASCNGLVKPDIVFFGEQLPQDFFLNRTLPAAADLCIVMGTSLSVQPFAGLPGTCAEGVPRLLINLEVVGGLGSRTDDVLLLCDCDAGVRKLVDACGWLEELEALWAKTSPKQAMERLAAKNDATEDSEQTKQTKDEKLEAEVEKLTREVEETLQLSERQRKAVFGVVGKGSDDKGNRDEDTGPMSEKKAEKAIEVQGAAKEVESSEQEKAQRAQDPDESPAEKQPSTGNHIPLNQDGQVRAKSEEVEKERSNVKVEISEKPTL